MTLADIQAVLGATFPTWHDATSYKIRSMWLAALACIRKTGAGHNDITDFGRWCLTHYAPQTAEEVPVLPSAEDSTELTATQLIDQSEDLVDELQSAAVDGGDSERLELAMVGCLQFLTFDVERGVGYVKGSFVAGREALTLKRANQTVQGWCVWEAGLRQHGTTRQQPLRCFQDTEQAALQPLPEPSYDLATWKAVRLHRDGYVVFDGAYYSAPFRYVGQKLWGRGDYQAVKLYTPDYQLIATHTRVGPGQRQTQPDHLVPYKQPGVLWTAEVVQDKAQGIGPATFQTVQRLFETPVVDPLSTIRRLIKLADQYGPARLEAACARALAHDDPAYRTVKRILQLNLDAQGPALPAAAEPSAPVAATFARSVNELLGDLAQVQL